MEKYLIDYGTGAGNQEVEGTLEEAMKIADKGACYTQCDICIYNQNGDIVAARQWWGVTYDDSQLEEEDSIEFGTFGYYSDWNEEYGKN